MGDVIDFKIKEKANELDIEVIPLVCPVCDSPAFNLELWNDLPVNICISCDAVVILEAGDGSAE